MSILEGKELLGPSTPISDGIGTPHSVKLGWSDPYAEKTDWQPMEWTYTIDTLEQFEAGVVQGLLARVPGLLRFPDELHWTIGPNDYGDKSGKSRVWVIYRDDHDRVWILRSTEDFTDIEHLELATWSPQGSRWPSIEFDDDGQIIQAVAFRPAGQDHDEIWMVREGQSAKKITDGEHPILYRDPHDDILLFYHRDGAIWYRALSQNWNTEHSLSTVGDGVPTLKAVRTWSRYQIIDGVHYLTYQPVAIYSVGDERFVHRYVMAEEIREIIKWPMSSETEDASVLYVEFGTIVWERGIIDDVEIVDAVGLSVAFDEIVWEEVWYETVETADAVALSVGFGEIEWMEIVFVSESTEDAVGLSVEFGTILWIEV